MFLLLKGEWVSEWVRECVSEWVSDGGREGGREGRRMNHYSLTSEIILNDSYSVNNKIHWWHSLKRFFVGFTTKLLTIDVVLSSLWMTYYIRCQIRCHHINIICHISVYYGFILVSSILYLWTLDTISILVDSKVVIYDDKSLIGRWLKLIK